jgi:hypothetical protein
MMALQLVLDPNIASTLLLHTHPSQVTVHVAPAHSICNWQGPTKPSFWFNTIAGSLNVCCSHRQLYLVCGAFVRVPLRCVSLQGVCDGGC